MHILFVYPNVRTTPAVPQGIALLSAIAKSNDHTTSLFDTTFTIEIKDYRDFPEKEARKVYEDFNRQVEQEKPDLIAFTSTTSDYPFAERMLNHLRNQDTPVVFGGVHATIMPEEVIDHPRVNAICIGEGEHAFAQLIRAMESGDDIASIKNLWVKKNGQVVKNELDSLIPTLDMFPTPDLDLFDERHFMVRHRISRFRPVKCLVIENTRGCPFPCTYCQNHRLRELYRGKGKYVRSKSTGYLIEQMKDLVARHGFEVVAFNDETFLANDIERIEVFCRQYKEEIGLPFHITLRAELVKEEPLRMLKEAGCRTCSIGIETGDEDYRKKILKRKMTDKQILDAFQVARKVGLRTMSFNMVGLPYQDREDIFRSIELTRQANPDFVLCSILYPYPRTEIYELCRREGFLKDDAPVLGEVFRQSILEMPQISQEEIQGLRRTFHLYCKSPMAFFPLIRLLEKDSLLSEAICRYFLYVFEAGWWTASRLMLEKALVKMRMKAAQ